MTHSVSAALIEQELNKIWNNLQKANKTRASLFNLIFYTQKTQRTEYIRSIAKKVIEKFPSRIFFVLSDESELNISVSVLSASEKEYAIACDLIQIELPKKEEEKIPFLILPHLLSDLPVYLIWGEDPCQKNPLLNTLSSFVDRLIFDSESTDNLSRFGSAILFQKKQARCDIADLNWARLESWRNLLSATFYSEEKLHHLEHAKQITINYNARPTTFFGHTRIQALYLQGWIACQLGWQLQEMRKEKESWIFSYKTENGTTSIVLGSVESTDFPPGMVLSFDLITASEVHYAFVRQAKIPHQITLIVSTKEQCDMPIHFALEKADSGQSLVKEICHRGTSLHYLKLLELLTSMEKFALC